MTEKIFFASRNHSDGPGEWWIRSKRLPDWHFFKTNSKMMVHIVADILNDPEKYSEFDGYGLSSIRFEEQLMYDRKDDKPAPKIQESVMNSINDIIKGSTND